MTLYGADDKPIGEPFQGSFPSRFLENLIRQQLAAPLILSPGALFRCENSDLYEKYGLNDSRTVKWGFKHVHSA
jgi:hypothetical protein